MRYFYTFLLYLILPFLFLRLLWRSFWLSDYRRRLGERLGFYPFRLRASIWVHAVSVGETLAAIPLIRAIQTQYPDLPVVVSTMTPTGAARVKAALGESVIHVYLPYDFPDAVARFLRAVRPVMGVIMETELWPNLLAACARRHIPVCLLNARLSASSAKGYQRIAYMTKAMLRQLTWIGACGPLDAERFIALGAPAKQVSVTGNIKFDLQVPAALPVNAAAFREKLGTDRFVWIAASTHEGEEEKILMAHHQLRAEQPRALLILVPRHPDRFNAAAALCEREFVTQRRSDGQAAGNDMAVYLGDTMGELLLLYGASDVAFIGGSLVPHGGHNLLEPAALGKPVLCGPHLFNFVEIRDLFLKADALIEVDDAATLAAKLIHLTHHPIECAQQGQRARAVVEANRGALLRQIAIIRAIMPS